MNKSILKVWALTENFQKATTQLDMDEIEVLKRRELIQAMSEALTEVRWQGGDGANATCSAHWRRGAAIYHHARRLSGTTG